MVIMTKTTHSLTISCPSECGRLHILFPQVRTLETDGRGYCKDIDGTSPVWCGIPEIEGRIEELWMRS